MDKMKLPGPGDVRPTSSGAGPCGAAASLRPWMIGWLALPILGIANGAVREATYKRTVSGQTADQVSTAVLLGLMTAYMRTLNRRWPISTSRAAFAVGGIWAMLTITFEFGFGHYVVKEPWPKLLNAYNITGGQLWPAVPLWAGLGPEAIRRLPIAGERKKRPSRPLHREADVHETRI